MDNIAGITPTAVTPVTAVSATERIEEALAAYTELLPAPVNEPGVEVFISEAGRIALALEQEQLQAAESAAERLAIERQSVLEQAAFADQLARLQQFDFILAAQELSLVGNANAQLERRYEVDKFIANDNRVMRSSRAANASYYRQAE